MTARRRQVAAASGQVRMSSAAKAPTNVQVPLAATKRRRGVCIRTSRGREGLFLGGVSRLEGRTRASSAEAALRGTGAVRVRAVRLRPGPVGAVGTGAVLALSGGLGIRGRGRRGVAALRGAAVGIQIRRKSEYEMRVSSCWTQEEMRAARRGRRQTLNMSSWLSLPVQAERRWEGPEPAGAPAPPQASVRGGFGGSGPP